MSAPGWVACVDFGTAYSKAAVAPGDAWTRFDAAEVRPLALSHGSANPFLLDSALFVAGDAVLFGAAALERVRAGGPAKRQALRSFKTILSAPDLERALATRATASIDPSRGFTLRDLVVLYLAYLTDAVEAAIAADKAIGAVDLWRYATPAWRDDRVEAHRVIERLFGEARAVRASLRFGESAVPLADAQRAVAAARTGAPPWRMDMVYEATAAAVCSAIALPGRASHVIVIDIGAGTTDIAALAGAADIFDARVTLTQAGDFIDRIILNLALDASPTLKTEAQRTALWTAMAPDIRDLKETLFATGAAAFRHDGKVIAITLRDFMRDKGFKTFETDLANAYRHALKLLRERAKKDKAREVMAVSVGGGASAPFIQKLIGQAPGAGVKVRPRPPTPEWAHDDQFGGNLAPVFPQLAVAIGGALAPHAMLAASGPS